MVYIDHIYINMGYVVLILPLYIYSAGLQHEPQNVAAQVRDSLLQQQATQYQKNIDTLKKEIPKLEQEIAQMQQKKLIWGKKFTQYHDAVNCVRKIIHRTKENIDDLGKIRLSTLLPIALKRYPLITEPLKERCGYASDHIKKHNFDRVFTLLEEIPNIFINFIDKNIPIHIVTQAFGLYVNVTKELCVEGSKELGQISDIFNEAQEKIFSCVQQNNLKQARLIIEELRKVINPHQEALSPSQAELLNKLVTHLIFIWDTRAVINDEYKSSKHEKESKITAEQFTEIEAEKKRLKFWQRKFLKLKIYTICFAKKLEKHAQLKKQFNDTEQEIYDLGFLLAKTGKPPQQLSPDDPAIMPAVHAALQDPSRKSAQDSPENKQKVSALPALAAASRSSDADKKPEKKSFVSRIFNFKSTKKTDTLPSIP